MAKNQNKTTENAGSVDDFLNSVDNDRRRADAQTVMDMMARITGHSPAMWGTSLIGFDSYHYRYDSGREGDFFRTGLSPRKTALTVYIMPGFDAYEPLLSKLGKYKTGRSCLYINKLADVDLDVLESLIEASYADMNKMYPQG